MQKNILLVPLIALIFLLAPSFTSLPTQAASPSPSPVTSDSASAEQVTDNLKKRLQESIDSVGDDLRVVPQSTSRAYIGVIKDVIKDTLIIQDKDGKKDVKLQDDTTILRSPGNALIKPENIRLGDYIIAIGYPSDDGILLGHRLIVSADSITPPAKTSGLGTISELSNSSLTLQIGDQEQILGITGKTIFKSPGGTIEFSDLGVGDTVIYTALVGKNDAQTATILLRIQTSAIISP